MKYKEVDNVYLHMNNVYFSKKFRSVKLVACIFTKHVLSNH